MLWTTGIDDQRRGHEASNTGVITRATRMGPTLIEMPSIKMSTLADGVMVRSRVWGKVKKKGQCRSGVRGQGSGVRGHFRRVLPTAEKHTDYD